MAPHTDEDIIELIEDSETTAQPPQKPWRILIVDDDDDVHRVTRFAINGNLKILNREVEFLSAYSAKEAESILTRENDISMILLDCVMETETAGLDLVGRIRNNLQLKDVRIVLRTGQPGYAPESKVIAEYDINDYHTKSDLTSQRLVTSITAALRSYQQLRFVYDSGILFQKIIAASNDLMSKHDPEVFYEAIITHIRSFFAEDIDCLVAVNNSGSDDTIKVKAASTLYQDHLEQDPTISADNDINLIVKLAFENWQNVFIKNVGALYIDAGEQQIVVYLHAPAEILEFQQNLLFLLTHNITLCAKNLRPPVPK